MRLVGSNNHSHEAKARRIGFVGLPARFSCELLFAYFARCTPMISLPSLSDGLQIVAEH